MDAKKWQRAKEIFADAVEKPDGDRTAFVGSACGDDVELRASVESLLASRDPSTTFLEPPEEGAVPELLSAATQHNELGRRIGPYELIEVIATGGMGTIYRAARADSEYETEVAVKLIKPGMDSVEAVRRFRRERQVLATLEHPNIARLLDGAVTEDGSPYLVMEYIAGAPIHQYCDESDLKVDRRLRLFRDVCAAVQHAHQALVVHRDLKPSNILVTPEGVPKLLDFGIAKLLDPTPGSLPADTTVTAFRLMTPQYASPEQIRGDAITTASDVYSLGVILYELLTGHRPYNLKTGSRAEMERILCDVEPATPSTAIGRTREIKLPDGTTGTLTPETVSARRGTRPEKLARSLRGDLDTIVLAAMHKDPSRRYGSVRQLSDDIDRYLTGLPVLARRDTFRYRAGKFVRRNKFATIATAAAIVALIGGTIGTTVGMHQARDALATAECETEKALTEAAKADKISEFLQDMLTSARPSEGGKDISVRELLVEAAGAMEAGLAEFPAVRAQIHRSIGATYYSLGMYDKARVHLGAALEIRRTLDDDAQPLLFASSLNDMGQLLRTTGAIEEAVTHFQEALSLYRLNIDGDHLDIAAVLNNLALCHRQQGDHRAAEDMYGQAIDMLERLGEQSHPDYAVMLFNMASVLRRSADYDTAEAKYTEALEAAEGMWGRQHPFVAVILAGLGVLHADIGEYEEAEAFHEESLAIRRDLLPPDHPELADSLHNLGKLMRKTGRYPAAEKHYREALDILREAFDDNHNEVAKVLTSLGVVQASAGDHAGAEVSYLEALRIRRENFGDDHPAVATLKSNLAKQLVRRHEYESASRLYREAADTWRKHFGDAHHRVALAVSGLASVHYDQGHLEQAESLAREALAIRQAAFPEGHPDIATSMYFLGIVLSSRAQYEEAEPLLRECVRHRQRALPANHWRTALAEAALGKCLIKLARYEAAEPVVNRAHSVLREALGDEDSRTLMSVKAAVELYDAWGKPDKTAEWRAKLPAEGTKPEAPKTEPIKDKDEATPDASKAAKPKAPKPEPAAGKDAEEPDSDGVTSRP